MYHSFLIHSSADGHLGCFHVLTGPFDLAGSNSNGRKHFYSALYVPGTILSTLHTINAFNSSLSPFEEGLIIISIVQI